MLQRYNRTLFFYGLSMLVPWMLWFSVAYLSHLPDQTRGIQIAQRILGPAGLLAPVLLAAYLFLADEELLKDLKSRIFNTKDFRLIYMPATFFLIPVSLVLAQLLSIFLGHGLDQFRISGSPSFTSTFLSPWFILIFAPIAEELAWHSYGTDTLRRKFNLFNTCLIFSVYWVLWHIPLSFIKGYYHSNVVAEGWLYSANFAFSLFVFVILMNWLYYRTGRNIFVAVVFHLSANVTNEIFATHPDSKVIQTALLLLAAIAVVVIDRKLFFLKTSVD
ncbi:MAG: CPBP family intramembrane metalloprotease [Leptospiraceae bacterium]|nr:CPBP family intramembrane metalloprotease [Leptospiraceae bacterium]